MASKWLAAFRETEDAPPSVSQPRADSADSADSTPPPPESRPNGTNGTNGTPEQPDSKAEHSTIADDLDKRAAIIEEGANVPRRWAEGFAAMASMPAPTGFSPERWARIVDATGTFLDRWAAKVIACGWSDLDVFGCDSAAPDRRFDCMGLVLLLDRWEVSGVDEAGADLVTETGAPLRYRRRPLPGHTVSLWQLAK